MKKLLLIITSLNLIVCFSLLLGGSALAWSGQILGTGKMINIYGTTSAQGTVAVGTSEADEPIDWIKVDISAIDKNGNGCTPGGSDERTNDDIAYASVSCTSGGHFANSTHQFSNWGEMNSGTSRDPF
jgi:hypothetical protein